MKFLHFPRLSFARRSAVGIVLVALCAFGRTVAATAEPAVLTSSIINPDAPYPECHASTIVELPSGQLAAAWFGGTKERNPDVVIWFARHENGRWQPAREVADGVQADGSPRLPTWNPVLFQPKGGPLHLFHKIGPNPREWWGMVMTSTDGGKSWSAPRRLPEGILGPVKNKPIVLADGAWLSGSSTEGTETGWRLHFELSRDAGKTWTKIDPVDKGPANLDAIQPSLLVHEDGSLHAVGRTKQGVVFQTSSKDKGATWSPLTATNLPNPSSGTDAVTLADGRHLIVYNHMGNRPGEAKGNRFPLAVAVSRDGETWQRVVTLESEEIKEGYAYPAVIQASDGRVHVTYTHGRKTIRHAVLDPKKF